MKKAVGIFVAFAVVATSAIYLAIVLTSNKTTPPAGLGTPPPTGVSPVPSVKHPTKSPGGSKSNKDPFGVLIPSMQLSIDQQISVDQQLRVRYVRPAYPVFAESPDLACVGCTQFEQAGFKVILTVRDSPDLTQPSTAPPDMGAYKSAIGTIIDRYHPTLLVIENEENVPDHYSGTPEEYGAMLKAACQVAHQKHTLCTNGGLLSGAVTYLVYQHYMDAGQTAQAQDYASRAFEDFQMALLNGPNGAEEVAARAAAIVPFLDADQTSGADFLNFHWYVGDAQALAETAGYLAGVTGMHVVCNEMGQRNVDPQTTTSLMAEVLKLGLPYAVWYATDARLARGILNANGSLRPTGQAFQSFISSNF